MRKSGASKTWFGTVLGEWNLERIHIIKKGGMFAYMQRGLLYVYILTLWQESTFHIF